MVCGVGGRGEEEVEVGAEVPRAGWDVGGGGEKVGKGAGLDCVGGYGAGLAGKHAAEIVGLSSPGRFHSSETRGREGGVEGGKDEGGGVGGGCDGGG